MQMIYIASGLFILGLVGSAGILFNFEFRLRRERAISRLRTGRALRGLIGCGLVSGLGIGILGMAAVAGVPGVFPGGASHLIAAVLLFIGLLGWPLVVVVGFMARVNSLR